jgi:hypothetical protein
MRMIADLKPNKRFLNLRSERSMIDANSYRPCVFGDLLKLKGWMKGISAPDPILFARKGANWGWKRSIGVPEILVRAADHGRRRVFPARKSDLAWSIKRRNRPPGCASSAIWLSQMRALYSASHSAKRSISAGGSCSISVCRSSTFLMLKVYPCFRIHSSPFILQPALIVSMLNGRKAIHIFNPKRPIEHWESD